MKSTSKIQVRLLLYMSLFSLAVFAAAHVHYAIDNSITLYVRLYALKVWDFLFPVVVTYFALINFAIRGAFNTSVLLISFLATRALYYVPYYYEYFVLEEGYMTGDALLISFLRFAVEFVLGAVHILALFLIAVLLLSLLKRRNAEDLNMSEYILFSNDDSPYSFSSPLVFLSLSVSVCQFLYALALEITDTAEFLGEYIGTVEINELATIIFNYILITALAVFAHFYLLPRIKEASLRAEQFTEE